MLPTTQEEQNNSAWDSISKCHCLCLWVISYVPHHIKGVSSSSYMHVSHVLVGGSKTPIWSMSYCMQNLRLNEFFWFWIPHYSFWGICQQECQSIPFRISKFKHWKLQAAINIILLYRIGTMKFLPIWQRLGTVEWLLDIIVLKDECERDTHQTLIFFNPIGCLVSFKFLAFLTVKKNKKKL